MSDITEYLDYLWHIWQRRWIVLAAATLVCVIGWSFVVVLPDQYQVNAKIHVDTETILKPLLQGLAVDSDITKRSAELLQKTLLTRSNLEKIARSTDMDLNTKTPSEFEDVIWGLAERIHISGGSQRDRRQQQIYSVTYTDIEAKRAKVVVDEVLTLFVEESLGAVRKDTNLTQDFLNKQIVEYEQKLRNAEERLKEFKSKNIGLMPTDGSSYFVQLNQESTQLSEAQLNLDEALNRRKELKRQLQDVIKAATKSGKSASPAIEAINQRITEMEKKLDELLLQFTEEHPDVVSVRRILDDLEQKKKRETRKITSDTAEGIALLDNNPVYQELKVALGEEQTKIAALQVRVNMYRDNVVRLEDLMGTIPKVEAELAKLNRDYNVIHNNYLELVKRRESAKISFDAGSNPDDVQFKIIDPPRVPLRPKGPNRLVLFTGILGAGIGVGVGIVLLLLQLKPTFNSIRGLTKKTGFPVIGTISLVTSSTAIAKERINLLIFGVLAIILCSVYAGLVLTQLMNINLQQYLN